MPDNPKTPTATVIPTLRYDDAAAAIAWLCEAFGFEEQLVVPGDDGTVVHAQLVLGNGMVMLGSARASAFDALQKPPSGLGGVVSQSAYIVVDDPDAHHARAVAAGAEIVMDLRDEDYGGREYSCRDPEGHVWNFGSYDPWASAATPGSRGGAQQARARESYWLAAAKGVILGLFWGIGLAFAMSVSFDVQFLAALKQALLPAVGLGALTLTANEWVSRTGSAAMSERQLGILGVLCALLAAAALLF